MRLVLWPLGLVLAAGCAGGGATTPMTVRDSAGVTIVESISPRWEAGEGWRVDTVPLLDLGGGEGGPAFEFDGVADALRLPDGSVVVADFGSREIRRFGPDGQVQWVMGREGEGPGEFNRIRNLTRFRNDSLLVWDFWLGRGTVLSQDGSVGRVFRLATLGRADRLYPLDDSTLVAVFISLELMDRAQGLFRVPNPLLRVRAGGETIDTIGVLPGGETFILADGDARPLFGKLGHVAVWNGRLHLGTADRVEYGIHDVDGSLRRLVRAPGVDLSLTAEQVGRERAALIPPTTHPQHAYVRDLITGLPTPPSRPGYARMLVDATGAVWLERFRGTSEAGIPIQWEVFDATGEWLGPVMMPDRFRVREIGVDYVLGVGRDADNVEQVRVLRLNRR